MLRRSWPQEGDDQIALEAYRHLRRLLQRGACCLSAWVAESAATTWVSLSRSSATQLERTARFASTSYTCNCLLS